MTTKRSNYQLFNKVIENSVADVWDLAVREWEIVDCEESEEVDAVCVCGKEHIRYMFTIRNTVNGNTLVPIGSSCIRKFQQPELSSLVDVYERLFKLLDEYSKNNFVPFNSKLFSRKLLLFLFDQGCFEPNEYNNWDPANDYKFLLDQFNARKDPSDKQKRKISALMCNAVIPYLKKKLHK